MESTFDVDGKAFKVEFSVFGFEKYYYDGNLLLKRWSCKFKDRLSFECGKRNVEIDISISSKNWSIQAFIDGRKISLDTHQTKLWKRYSDKFKNQ